MWLVAADTPPPQDAQTAIILAAIGLVSALGVSALGGYFTYRASRDKAEAAPVVPLTPALDTKAYERIAVVERRAEDNDERDEVQDRRLDQIERHLDLQNPRWRHL